MDAVKTGFIKAKRPSTRKMFQRFSLGGSFLQRGTNESEAPGSVCTNTASICKSTLRMVGLQRHRIRHKENTKKKQRVSEESSDVDVDSNASISLRKTWSCPTSPFATCSLSSKPGVSKPSSGRVYWSIFSLASHPNHKDVSQMKVALASSCQR